MATTPALRFRRRFAFGLISGAMLGLGAPVAMAAPPIRSSEENPVPACVTPERLMAFLEERNSRLDARFRDIASYYAHYGQGWRVRWDYAFFQMLLETNYLTFRRGDGSHGDVRENQNNFAGIGATGGGVHGERFPDVATGVHAQIQHLVAYSGERLAQPIAARTRAKQDDIVDASRHLGRPVTFGDLARRWAVDRAYGKSIDFVAGLYRARYCADGVARSAEEITAPAPQPARRDRKLSFPPPSGLGGPKPDKLAGPDTEPEAEGAEQLPWLLAPAKKKQSPKEVTPTALSPKQTSKRRSQVKTIWSRGDIRKFDPGRSPPPASGDSWADVTVVRERSADRRDTSDASTGSSDGSHGASARSDDAPTLPTFRIAPLAATPSRLGGPLPADFAPAPARVPQPSNAASAPCHVVSASYGGTKTLLVRSVANGETQYTALTVLDGFERSMFETYAKSQPAGGQIVGEYPSRDDALSDARVNCPEG